MFYKLIYLVTNTSWSNIVQVLQYLLDDVSDFLATHFTNADGMRESKEEERGCCHILKAFIDFISLRETENFRSRRLDNQNSVTLTTIHQVIVFAAIIFLLLVFFSKVDDAYLVNYTESNIPYCSQRVWNGILFLLSRYEYLHKYTKEWTFVSIALIGLLVNTICFAENVDMRSTFEVHFQVLFLCCLLYVFGIC